MSERHALLAHRRRYIIEFGASICTYTATVIISSAMVHSHSQANWRYAVAVLPVVPALFALLAVLRQLKRLDELERKIQLQALGFSATATSLLSFTYGFLELAGLPRLSFLWILPLQLVLWGVGVSLTRARYQ